MAVLEADVVGYSEMVAANAQGVADMLAASGQTFMEIAERHQGQVRDRVGDSFLLTFESALDAVNAAIALQEEMGDAYDRSNGGEQMHFRAGVEMGDVWEDDRGHLVGNAVNCAARLESLASAGGICISGAVWAQAQNYIVLKFEDQGEKSLKNIPHPVRAYMAQVYTVSTPEKKPQPALTPRLESVLPRLGRKPTNQEWFEFFRDTFQLLRAQFRENLNALRDQSGGRVNTDLQEIHNRLFICRILSGSSVQAQAKIWLSQNQGEDGKIFFSTTQVDGRMGGDYDEALAAAEADDALALKATKIPHTVSKQHFDPALLSEEGTTDYLWWMLVKDL